MLHSPGTRLAAYYVALFACLGVLVPFWPLWFEAQGLDKAGIGLVIAAGLAARALAPPLWGRYADRTGSGRDLLPGLTLAAAALLAVLVLGEGLAWYALVSFGFGCTFHALLPLTDDLTNRALPDPDRYGQIRLWGSLSFLVTTLVAGRVLDALGPGSVPAMALVPLVLGAGLALWLPAPRKAPRPDAGTAGGGENDPGRPAALADPQVRRLLLGTALVQGSHAPYYGLASVHWKDHGADPTTIALLWAEGVAAEILLFAVAHHLLRRFPARYLLRLGAGAAVLRWVGLALTTDPLWLATVQWLHALSFGATFLGAVRWIAVRCDTGSAAVQGLHSTGIAIVMGLAILAGGTLAERSGVPLVFSLSAAVAATGCLVLSTLERSRRPRSPV